MMKGKALWVIEKHPSLDCYYIKHAIDGKYLTYNAGFFSNKGRVRFHLEESPSNNDYALFFINYYSATGSYEIISKYASDNNIDPDSNKPRKYLNINKGNQQSLAGTDADKTSPFYSGGLIGLWTVVILKVQEVAGFTLNLQYQSTLLPLPIILMAQ